MPFNIIRNDITKVDTDAIVNSANHLLKQGGGVSGAIFSAAGAKRLQDECDRIGFCDTGDAVITSGYDLSAKYVIHTVGPVWSGGHNNEENLLYNCYYNSMKLALKNNCKSIAFPLISSGIFNYPKDRALDTAISAISDFLKKHEMMVFLVVYDKKAFEISEKRFYDVKKYISDNYVDEHIRKRINILYERSLESEAVESDIVRSEYSKKRNLNDVIAQIEETFSKRLLRLIDEKGKSDVEIYTKANISRKLFSKIRINKDYHPSKITALAFSISLELSLDETLDLLETAGFTLSNSSVFDIIVKYFIEEKIYNIYEINNMLFEFDQILICA